MSTGFIANPVFENRHVDTLIALVEEGPVYDGDLPSKTARNDLVRWGYAVKVIVKGEDGFQAATVDAVGKYCQIFNGNTVKEAMTNRKSMQRTINALQQS